MKSLKKIKQQLRKSIRSSLRKLPGETLKSESKIVAEKLFETKAYKSSRALCVFLNMPKGEIDTSLIVRQAFKDNKRCFFPRCISKTEMIMLEGKSLNDVESFEKSSWDIPEPRLGEGRELALDCKELDLIVMPGLAFDSSNRRCGQGAGYYDRFLEKLSERRKKEGLEMPKLIGIALKCQIVDEVPVDDFDFILDEIVTSV
mmetsp:Transcript_17200/g.25800  ORF Transcript_17200/g.25800 Transcript_17200/m.25800 type:complete len:202 (-) Transcript_17200:138-743(-)